MTPTPSPGSGVCEGQEVHALVTGRGRGMLRGAGLSLALVGAAARIGAEDLAPVPPLAISAAVLKEHRYRMSAAIRPLLFWIGDKDVGGARIVWRRDALGQAGYEFLLGSDPNRAPRRINRWGFVRELAGPSGATQFGLIRKTEEESFEQAHRQAGFEGDFVFKVIRTEVSGGTARSENTVFRIAHDLTYHDLPELIRIVEGQPQAPPRVNAISLPPGTHPGFLLAVADLVDRAVAGALRTPRELLREVTAHFNFNALVYELRLRSTAWEESEEFGGRRYDRLVRIDFESHNPKLRTTERFTLVCGTEGTLRGVPVYVKYQPKWWFRAEGVLDETQSFEAGRRRDSTGGG